MNTNTINSRIIGLFFILPLLFYGIGNNLADISSTTFDPASNYVTIGGFLMILNSITVIAIGILLFPILSRFQKGVALTYLVTRICEGLLLLIGVISLFSITATSTPEFQNLKTFALGLNYYSFQISMFILGLGSVLFCYTMYKHKSIPPYLGLWGCLGYGLLLAGAICEMFGYGIGIALSIPGGLFELSFGLWLMFKGFRSAA